MSFETTPSEIAGVVHSIQLAVAPVFLLSGIGVLLGVLTSRLARVVDRARQLEDRHFAADPAEADDLGRQLASLARRASLMNMAITLSTVSALLVASVVALLFGSTFINFNLALPVAAGFILAMIALIGALLSFLIEVRVAIRTIRIGPRPR